MPLSPPLPVWAGFWTAAKELMVVWDQPIAPGPLDPTNWTGRFKVGVGGAFVCDLHLDTHHKRTSFHAQFLGVGVFPHDVSYAATPPDITGRTGVPAVSFRNFPLNVFP